MGFYIDWPFHQRLKRPESQIVGGYAEKDMVHDSVTNDRHIHDVLRRITLSGNKVKD